MAGIFYTAPNTINGEVTSPDERCIPKRLVNVKKSRPGTDRRVGSDRSAPTDGYYEVADASVANGGAFYAKVAERKVHPGKCAPFRTSTITITTR